MKLNEKWMLFLIATFVTFFGIADTLLRGTKANEVNVEEQVDALLATAQAYYNQGTQHQYDSYKKNLYSTPEDATSQHYTYTVCSGFTFQTYYQTLGIRIPDTTEGLLDYAETNQSNSDIVLAYYGSSDEVYSEDALGTAEVSNYTNLIKEWADIVQVGDVLVVTGHAMMVSSVDKENGTITIIESAFDSGEGRYDYDNHVDKFEKTNGTIRYNELSTKFKTYYNKIVNNYELIERVALIRFITDGETFLNEDGEEESYTITDAALSRLKYPEIDIEKIVHDVLTVDGDLYTNVLTQPGEYITYKLTIKNNSDTEYSSFDVIENIDNDKVSVESLDGGELINDGQQIKWSVSSLGAGESYVINYMVRVKNDNSLYGKVLVSTGYVDNIATSRIETLIGNRLSSSEVTEVKEAYNNLKDGATTERQFINQIYMDALGIDLGITGLANLDIINYDSSVSTGGGETLSVKSTNVGSVVEDGVSVSSVPVSKYIYHNFYGLRVAYQNDPENNIVRAILQWNIYPEYEINDRARTLTSDMLYDGDVVLVYTGETDTTDENLVDKSYIYLDNKLVRKISATEFEEISGDELAVFLRNIIGDNYVILRPSIAMIDVSEEDNENEEEVVEEKIEFDSSLQVDKDNLFINKVLVNTTIDDILSKIDTTGKVNVLDKDNNIIEDTSLKVKTGDQFEIELSAVTYVYTISVQGDIDGDGAVNKKDVINASKHLIQGGVISGDEYLKAADINGDGKISINDVIKLAKHVIKGNEL